MTTSTEPDVQNPFVPRPLGRAGTTAAALFVIHALVLFLPPLPPDVKGSLWSYVLGYTGVVFAAIEVRAHAPALAAWCAGFPGPRRAALGLGSAAIVLTGGLAIRWYAPALFERWSREEGVWEPLTLMTFLAAAFLLFAAARIPAARAAARTDAFDDRRGAHQRRHLQLFGAGYLLLVLEEIDYFGIFGGIIGRVEGVYVGSPHDLIGLAAKGLLPLWAVGLLAGGAVMATALLLRAGLLQPARFARALLVRRGLWLLAYGLLIAMAQVEDLSLFYLLGEPRIEELLELTGAVLLLAFAADLAASATDSAADRAADAAHATHAQAAVGRRRTMPDTRRTPAGRSTAPHATPPPSEADTAPLSTSADAVGGRPAGRP